VQNAQLQTASTVVNVLIIERKAIVLLCLRRGFFGLMWQLYIWVGCNTVRMGHMYAALATPWVRSAMAFLCASFRVYAFGGAYRVTV
jgi:hypothetical protein